MAHLLQDLEQQITMSVSSTRDKTFLGAVPVGVKDHYYSY